MGYFIGFSDKHSLLVANIRNLRTGYVNPQYLLSLMIFFKMSSFGEIDMVVDAI